MKSRDHLRVAFLNLKANKVRSILSMLGIIIGTGAVIVVTSVVNGIRQATIDTMMMGSVDILRVRPSFSRSSGRFGRITLADVERLEKLPHIQSVLPEISASKEVKGVLGREKAQVVGVDSDYFKRNEYRLVEGRALTETDIESRRRYCLINKRLVKKIFGIQYPIGQRLRVDNAPLEGNTPLEVIGVYEESDQAVQWGKKSDLLVGVPTLLRMMQTANISSVEIKAKEGKVDLLKEVLTKLIESNPRQSSLLEIEDPRTYMKEMDKWAKVWMLQMVLIAGISLLVGGIGLMNVMLTTVAERTREVGLRKALGANSKIIQIQFLVESATLSGLGGLSGIGLGYFISKGIEIILDGKMYVSVAPISLVASLLFSLFIGIVFGLYPASKAASLSPVEALRYE